MNAPSSIRYQLTPDLTIPDKLPVKRVTTRHQLTAKKGGRLPSTTVVKVHSRRTFVRLADDKGVRKTSGSWVERTGRRVNEGTALRILRHRDPELRPLARTDA